METSKFRPSGQILLIEPSALGLDFILAGPQATAPPYTVAADGKAAVVTIRGPLSYDGMLFDSYEAIKGRVAVACQTDCPYVVLKIHSPGGDVAGAFDSANAIKAMCTAAGKKLIAYTDGDACSAAYAIMCVADQAVASLTAKVGSIGAIAQYGDETASDRAKGIIYNTITTGERKADGNSHISMSDESRAALQIQLDQAGAVFFDLVASNRPLKVDAIRGFQAGVFMGSAAKAAGLVDANMSWEELLTALATSGTIQGSEAATKAESLTMPDDNKSDDKKDAKSLRASLEAASKAGDAKATRALAAYDSDGDDDKDKAKSAKAESDDKEDKKDSAKAAKAEDDKKDDKEDKAMSAASNLAAALAASEARARELEAKLAKGAEAAIAAERSAFLASRPDLPEALVKSLEGLPLEQVKAIVGAVPQGFKSQVAELKKSPEQGSRQGDGIHASSNEQLNARMGLVTYAPSMTSKSDGVVQAFGYIEEKKAN